MPEIADYKLLDLLGGAGATAGVIIAGTILLQFASSKYAELALRYRELTREYREVKAGEPRHNSLRQQILIFRTRLRLLNMSSWMGGAALLALLVAVMAGGLSQLFPSILTMRTIGTVGLLGGVLLMGFLVFFQIWESVLARREIHEELSDLDDGVKSSPR